MQRVAESQRAITWSKAAGSFFPGLMIRGLRGTPDASSMEDCEVGPGSVWTVLSAAVKINYLPQEDASDLRRSFTVLLQPQGTMAAAQEHRHCEMQAGDMCLLDGQWRFGLEVYAEE
ncbi:MAG: hypothetical protein IT480_12870 [Gammaproteobacteria bacterium]|nr:hypothetical protein [Gammaproteobacteria bacterium]